MNEQPYPTVIATARELVRLELTKPGALLERLAFRRAAQVAVANRRTHGEVESALDMLVERGLVEERHFEGLVSPARPQAYRWAKVATVEALDRFVNPRVRCSGPGCLTLVAKSTSTPYRGALVAGGGERLEFCSATCRNRRTHRERDEARA